MNFLLKHILIVGLIVLIPSFLLAQSEIQIIKERINNELLVLEVDDENVSKLIESLKEDGSWPGINYVDVRSTAYEHRFHLENLLELSKAFNSKKSEFFKSEKLKAVFSEGVDFWIKHDFIANNWHTNEIKNPGVVIKILMLMENELLETQLESLIELAGRANFNCWGARPGGDQIKIAGLAAELAAFTGDEKTLKQAIEIMANEVQVSSGNGIKADLGFHHRVDRVTSIVSYGKGYADAFTNWAYRLRGTQFQYPEESIQLLVDFYLDGICKSMVHGWYKSPGTMNRGISRKGYLESFGAETLERLALVSEYRKNELQNIANIRNGVQKPNLSHNKFFWHSEYLSHQRPGFHATIRMHSERGRNMEYPHNQESLKMHHFADGACFISRKGTEFNDIFAVWDWQKIPGTTVVQKDKLPSYREIVKWGKTDFVGAITDGKNGVAAFDFDSPHDDLQAQKSWFFFDNEIVCLGAGINSKSDFEVATTLSQSLLKGDVFIKSKNKTSKLTRGEHQLDDVSWVFHDSLAYVFPQESKLTVSNKLQKGNWSEITKQERFKNESEEKDVFCAWLNHGKNPDKSTYEYIIKAGIAKNEVDEFIKNKEIKVLENSSEIQAVYHKGLGITQTVFYKAGTIKTGNGIVISSKQPGLVMIETSGRNISKLSVADPTRKLEKIQLEINPGFYGKGVLDIPLPSDGEAGKSVVIKSASELETVLRTPSSQKIHFEEPRTDGKHFIGEKYGGGIIIWLDEKREHGLIAALEDSHAGIQWKNGRAKFTEHFGDRAVRATNAKRDGIGAGEMNTLLIVSQQTEDEFFGDFAAKVATQCNLGGYGDWYLPSKKELEILHSLKDEIGGFISVNYWSSTEYNVGFAWGMGFKHYKSEYTFNKGTACAVRCIRKF